MLKLLFVTLLLVSSLFANKVIYFQYDQVPERVIKGEIFTVTFKTLSTVRNFKDIRYKFSNYRGLTILQKQPNRRKKGKYFYDTFHFMATRTRAKLPDVTASLVPSSGYSSTRIKGETLNVIGLNPKENYSNIIANELSLVEFKTTSFDNQHNIVIFVLKAKNSNIRAIHFNNVFKQGIESIKPSYYNAKVTYFVVIDKKLEKFQFSYFNLKKNKFIDIEIPIVVDDDSVSTQTDLKPHDQSHDQIKIYIASALSVLLSLFIIWRKKYIYFIVLILPIGYIVMLAMPQKEICIKQGAKIHLLPVKNGTIFETTQTQILLPREGAVKGFVKVELPNKKIGWVKDDDTCTY